MRQAEALAEKKPERVWGGGWVCFDDSDDGEQVEDGPASKISELLT